MSRLHAFVLSQQSVHSILNVVIQTVQVGVEKTKVNLENEAAQVEAEKCGVIAKDVTELQARCEKDLAAAEPLVAQAEAALDTLNKKDLGGCSKVCPSTFKKTHSCHHVGRHNLHSTGFSIARCGCNISDINCRHGLLR